jgi:hypothetical protein
MQTIRWRLNDPSEGPYRWSKVHIVGRTDGETYTVCGLIVPDQPYMADYAELTDRPDTCKTCLRLSRFKEERGKCR